MSNHQYRIMLRLLRTFYGWLGGCCRRLGRGFLPRILAGRLRLQCVKREADQGAQAKAHELRAQEMRRGSPQSRKICRISRMQQPPPFVQSYPSGLEQSQKRGARTKRDLGRIKREST